MNSVSYLYEVLETSKPFFGFGWIETKLLAMGHNLRAKLLNHSSASAGLKHLDNHLDDKCHQASKPFFGFGWIETLSV